MALELVVNCPFMRDIIAVFFEISYDFLKFIEILSADFADYADFFVFLRKNGVFLEFF